MSTVHTNTSFVKSLDTVPVMASATALSLARVNADVHSVHLPDGSHVGNLKRVGAIWKFKAIGYDTAGNVIPGGGPLTERHNTVFGEPDAVAVNALLELPPKG